MKKQGYSGDFDRTQCLPSSQQVSEKVASMKLRSLPCEINEQTLNELHQSVESGKESLIDELKTCVEPSIQEAVIHASDSIMDLSNRQHLIKSKSVEKGMRKKYLSSSEKSSSKQEKFKRQKKSKDIKNSVKSFSLCSQYTPTSMKDAFSDKMWFQEITVLLSQNACNLSRKMLATVQVCFAEFCSRMSTLRDNLVKTAKICELPLSQDTCEYKLKSYIKSCKIVRLEVEKSITRMRSAGKEYFESEERDYRRLKKKQMKASKKYFQSMEKIKQNSISKLEQKLLEKTKYFLKKFKMLIDSA